MLEAFSFIERDFIAGIFLKIAKFLQPFFFVTSSFLLISSNLHLRCVKVSRDALREVRPTLIYHLVLLSVKHP